MVLNDNRLNGINEMGRERERERDLKDEFPFLLKSHRFASYDAHQKGDGDKITQLASSKGKDRICSVRNQPPDGIEIDFEN